VSDTPKLVAAVEKVLNKAEGAYLVWSSGDGTYRSEIVFGLEAARRAVAAHLSHAPYELAQMDVVVASHLAEFDDRENCWFDAGNSWKSDGEQYAIGCMRVTESGHVEKLAHALKDALGVLKGTKRLLSPIVKWIAPSDYIDREVAHIERSFE
jgi:hypothetical protein